MYPHRTARETTRSGVGGKGGQMASGFLGRAPTQLEPRVLCRMWAQGSQIFLFILSRKQDIYNI